MALHPNFPESPHEIIDMTQGSPPFNLLGMLDIHCVPLEQTVGYLAGGETPPTEKATNFQYMGAWVNIASNQLISSIGETSILLDLVADTFYYRIRLEMLLYPRLIKQYRVGFGKSMLRNLDAMFLR